MRVRRSKASIRYSFDFIMFAFLVMFSRSVNKSIAHNITEMLQKVKLHIISKGGVALIENTGS